MKRYTISYLHYIYLPRHEAELKGWLPRSALQVSKRVSMAP